MSSTHALGQTRGLDPMVDISLATAGEILARNDPGARETEGLVRRIILAPPAPWSSDSGGLNRVSDLNPLLRKIAYSYEHPYVVPLAAIAILGTTFLAGSLLGRVTAPATRGA